MNYKVMRRCNYCGLEEEQPSFYYGINCKHCDYHKFTTYKIQKVDYYVERLEDERRRD